MDKVTEIYKLPKITQEENFKVCITEKFKLAVKLFFRKMNPNPKP